MPNDNQSNGSRTENNAGALETTVDLSQADKLLISFYRISGGSTKKIPYEELVLQAWHDFPDTFSLRNHPEHPDASDIHKRLYQNHRAKGLVVTLGNKTFRLTDKGIALGAELDALVKSVPNTHAKEQGRLARYEQAFIKHALTSRAFSTWQASEKDKLVDYDARMFFQFSTGTPIDERRRRRDAAFEAIDKACRLGVEGSNELNKLAKFLAGSFESLFEEA